MNSGSYQLRIVITSNIVVNVGALGSCRFPRGTYIYTGSAMRNLEARVERHGRDLKAIRWHIDHLLAHPSANLVEATVFPSTEREECDRNQALIAAGATVPVAGFGSSDCRRCPAHLLSIGRGRD
jgi:Uri superfamily endonuclease